VLRHSKHHLAIEGSSGYREARKLSADIKGFNAKTAVFITTLLGSMWTFWAFCILALLSLPAVVAAFDTDVTKLGVSEFLPAVVQKASVIALVAWVAQTFIQLTALAVLQVSNNAQMAAQEEHTAAILKGVEHAEDLLSLETKGGLQTVDERLTSLAGQIEKLSGKRR
jgi:hypothetical protein